MSRVSAARRAPSKLVEVWRNEANGITTLSLARAPVNGLNLELALEVRAALESAVAADSRGIVLTSSLPTVFSAGVDIREMHRPVVQRCYEFWSSLQDLWLTLYGLPIPTAAAINGSSPGAGCLLALSCEYRVMVESEHTIGFNGPMLGVVIPKWIQDTLIRTVGYRQAELALLRGKLFQPREALNIGLVDELAVDKNQAVAKCEAYLADFANVPGAARAATKTSLRQEAMDWLRKYREQDTRTFVDALMLPKVQEDLDNYIQSLKNRSK
ncbi:enoyl-CoA delta isomerase 1, mitochondrial-like [Phymastichus coffea]|uniref:enoyl-CoA delta isomerase 1, mitochondrial-like n=1 Tax=Phymastichus coffea TaxID=108790 RepID=UPI00273ADD0A|nr:enoyl-CoA delta isomerase 1, mitochondrial-like [Phymastichus coffea]